MSPRRIEVGPLLALAGAVVLLVSLFLDFYDPALTAWDVFEVLDLALAAVALVGGLAAAGLAGAPVPPLEGRVLVGAAVAALVLVAATLLNHPPAVSDAADPQLGLWLALAGAGLMAAGALLATARVRVSVDIEQRRRRVAAVVARDGDDASGPTRPQPAAAPERPDGPGAAPAAGKGPDRPGERAPQRPADGSA